MRNYSAAMLTFTAVAALAFSLSSRALWAQDVPVPDAAVVAPASAIQISRPFNKAIVRESVPVKLRDFPDGGYISVSIDDRFITAQALPRKRSDAVFVWDTKASYTTAEDPNTPVSYSDGAHAITIAVYDSTSKLVGKDTVSVQLANKINLPSSQGITLSYPWKATTSLRYQRRTTLTAAPTDGSTSEQTIQQSLLRYHRTVENTTGGSFLIRDEALPVDRSTRPSPFVSYVATHGLTQSLQNGFDIRARYRVVNTRGRVLSEVGLENGGEQLGFSIPVLPPRRVSVGAHWEVPIQMALDWASPFPTTVTATSTLEDFEWQDRYPTAKIRETYTGPASFSPRPGSPLPLLQSQDVKFERVIYFAYNAGRIVRMQTTLTLTSTAPGLLTSASQTSGMSGGQSYPGGQAYPGGSQGSGASTYPIMGMPGPGMPGPGMPEQGIPGPMSNPSPRRPRQGNPGYPGSGSGGYPGSQPSSGQGGPAGTEGVPVKLTYTETTVVLN